MILPLLYSLLPLTLSHYHSHAAFLSGFITAVPFIVRTDSIRTLQSNIALQICFMEPNHLTVRQIHLKKPGLFGKLVLCNRPQGVRSQKTQVNL